MPYYYYQPPHDDNAGCFGFLAIALIILFMAIYIGAYILLFFLGLGLLVGGVFCLIIYVRALRDAIQQLSSAPPIGRNRLTSIIKGYFVLMYNVTVNSVRETMTVVSNSFNKFLNYRVLSFQKWMWLTVVATVAVGEVFFVIGITLLQIAVITFVLTCIFYLLLAYMILNSLAALGYTSVLAVTDMIRSITMYQRMDHFVFSLDSSYSDLVNSFRLLFAGKKEYVKAVFSETAMRARNFFAYSSANKIFSIQKWFYLACGLVMFVTAIIYNVVFMVLYSVAFLLIWIVNLLWTTIATLIRLIRH